MLGFAERQVRAGVPKATLHRLIGDLVGARLLERGTADTGSRVLCSSSACEPQ